LAASDAGVVLGLLANTRYVQTRSSPNAATKHGEMNSLDPRASLIACRDTPSTRAAWDCDPASQTAIRIIRTTPSFFMSILSNIC